MKKIIAIFLSILALSVLAFAEIDTETPKEPRMVGSQKMMDVDNMPSREDIKENMMKIKELNKSGINLTGLENALMKVKNPNATIRLQENLIKFQDKHKERLERLENLEIESMDNETGEMRLKAKEEVRFFGFIKGKATKRFDIAANGTINERSPWYSIFYSEVSDE